MRRDVMIVGEAESRSIWSDLAKFPALIFEFMAFVPLEIIKMFRRGEYFRVLTSIAAFGFFSQLLGWAITNKPFWTYDKGKTTFASFWGVDGLIILAFGLVLAAIMLRRNSAKPSENI